MKRLPDSIIGRRLAVQERFYLDCYQTRLDTTVISQDEHGIVLADTIFCPLGGGQPADTGILTDAQGHCALIVNTVRNPQTGLISHCLACAPTLKPGTPVTIEIDWERRYRHMRMHTCQHLMATVLPVAVTSCNITEEGGRLDFSLPEGMTLDRRQLQQQLDQLIAEDHQVHMRLSTEEAMLAQPERIKTDITALLTAAEQIHLVEIDGVDLRSCGGTHVRHTKEIGHVVVKKIENKGMRNKRVLLELAD
jgi:misacylated tRNA(Ala) deacylase